MEKQSMFTIPVDGIINPEYLVIIGHQIEPNTGRKLPVIDHGVGGIGKIIVHITGIRKQVEINRIVDFVKLLHSDER